MERQPQSGFLCLLADGVGWDGAGDDEWLLEREASDGLVWEPKMVLLSEIHLLAFLLINHVARDDKASYLDNLRRNVSEPLTQRKVRELSAL